jgi:TRAP transporter TAXI family solute receptor
MKKLLQISAITFFAFVAVTPKGMAQEKWPSTITIGSFTKGSTSYPVNVAFAKLVSKYTPVNAAVREYAGGAPGIEALIRGDVDTWSQGQTDFYDAYLGQGLWKGKPQDLRFLTGVVFEGPLAFGVRPGEGIRTIKDLAGKRVMTKSAIPYQNHANELILKKAGVWDKVKHIQFASTGDIAPAMIEKTVDSFCWAIGAPFTLQIKEATGIDWISLTEDEANAVREIPGLAPWTATNWILEMYNYQKDKVLRSYAYLFAFAVRSEMKDDVAYGMLKAIYDDNHLDEVRSLSKNLLDTSLKLAVSDFWVPFHAGAVKYYKDKGVWTDKMEARQKELLAKRNLSR